MSRAVTILESRKENVTQCTVLTAVLVLAVSQPSEFAVLPGADSLVTPVSLFVLATAQLPSVLLSLTLQWPDVKHSTSVLLTGQRHPGSSDWSEAHKSW